MSKLLLFVLVLVVIYVLRKSMSKAAQSAEGLTRAPRTAEVETINACAHCGVLVPRSEGLVSAQGFFCSAEHMSLGPRDQA